MLDKIYLPGDARYGTVFKVTSEILKILMN